VAAELITVHRYNISVSEGFSLCPDPSFIVAATFETGTTGQSPAHKPVLWTFVANCARSVVGRKELDCTPQSTSSPAEMRHRSVNEYRWVTNISPK
jgi:hypothetical protein